MNPQIIVLITFLIFGIAAFSGKVKIHVAAMIIPIILEISGVLTFEETWAGLTNSSVIMMALYVMTGMWVGFIPTGGNAANYIAQNTIVEKLGGVGQFTYFTNMILKAPWVVIGTIFLLFLATKFAPDNGNIPDFGTAPASAENGRPAPGGRRGNAKPL